MKTNLRRLAPLGLILSLLAALSFIGILIVKGLAVGGIFTPPDSKTLDQALWICLGVFILGLALAALLDPARARPGTRSRVFRVVNDFGIDLSFIGSHDANEPTPPEAT